MVLQDLVKPDNARGTFKKAPSFDPTEFIHCRKHAVSMKAQHVELAGCIAVMVRQLCVVGGSCQKVITTN